MYVQYVVVTLKLSNDPVTFISFMDSEKLRNRDFIHEKYGSFGQSNFGSRLFFFSMFGNVHHLLVPPLAVSDTDFIKNSLKCRLLGITPFNKLCHC